MKRKNFHPAVIHKDHALLELIPYNRDKQVLLKKDNSYLITWVKKEYAIKDKLLSVLIGTKWEVWKIIETYETSIDSTVRLRTYLGPS